MKETKIYSDKELNHLVNIFEATEFCKSKCRKVEITSEEQYCRYLADLKINDRCFVNFNYDKGIELKIIIFGNKSEPWSIENVFERMSYKFSSNNNLINGVTLIAIQKPNHNQSSIINASKTYPLIDFNIQHIEEDMKRIRRTYYEIYIATLKEELGNESN